MFRRLLDRFNRFMYGRYGADSLYYTLLIVFLLLGFINTFLRSYILLVAADVLFIWALFRYFSKNIYQRREENRRFLDIIAKIKRFFKLNAPESGILKSAGTANAGTVNRSSVCPCAAAVIRYAAPAVKKVSKCTSGSNFCKRRPKLHRIGRASNGGFR